VVGIVRGLDKAVMMEDQGVYYKSILGTLEHIVSSEIGLAKRFNGFFPCPCSANHPLVLNEMDAIKAGYHDKAEALYPVLAEADALLVAYVQESAEANLAKRVSYVNYKGENVERAFWNMIVHVLNHSTHHRGEISALLDRKGVKNDYSGFNLYTR
jgi:uncharacterized damage-inducible protein DinB